MKIITRKDAKAKGMKTYFTGKACKFDHVSKRRTVNGECVACERIRKAKKVVAKVVEVKKMIRKVVFGPGGCIVSDTMIAV